MDYYIVKYTGHFGFIKPWTAVRDGETFSQQYLTQSTVEGMEKKLFPELLTAKGIHKIQRYRLAFDGMSRQMEVIQAADFELKSIKGEKKFKSAKRKTGILYRSILQNPVLHLAFDNEEAAIIAAEQHLCLCRNEDLIYPNEEILRISEPEFEEIVGFELRFGENQSGAFLVGYNRFAEATPMYGSLEIVGDASQYKNQ
jgi:hypothetical protein